MCITMTGWLITRNNKHEGNTHHSWGVPKEPAILGQKDGYNSRQFENQQHPCLENHYIKVPVVPVSDTTKSDMETDEHSDNCLEASNYSTSDTGPNSPHGYQKRKNVIPKKHSQQYIQQPWNKTNEHYANTIRTWYDRDVKELKDLHT